MRAEEEQYNYSPQEAVWSTKSSVKMFNWVLAGEKGLVPNDQTLI